MSGRTFLRISGLVDNSQKAFQGGIKYFFIFSLLHKDQKSLLFEGWIALGWSIDRPSISQRNSCLVRGLTSEAVFGHWNRPLSSRL